MKFSQLFAQDVAFFMKPAYIQVLIKTMPEAKIKQIFLLRVNKSRGSDLYFDVLHVQIFTQRNILGAMKFE